jgi:hypothetical protein
MNHRQIAIRISQFRVVAVRGLESVFNRLGFWPARAGWFYAGEMRS